MKANIIVLKLLMQEVLLQNLFHPWPIENPAQSSLGHVLFLQLYPRKWNVILMNWLLSENRSHINVTLQTTF